MVRLVGHSNVLFPCTSHLHNTGGSGHFTTSAAPTQPFDYISFFGNIHCAFMSKIFLTKMQFEWKNLPQLTWYLTCTDENNLAQITCAPSFILINIWFFFWNFNLCIWASKLNINLSQRKIYSSRMRKQVLKYWLGIPYPFFTPVSASPLTQC